MKTLSRKGLTALAFFLALPAFFYAYAQDSLVRKQPDPVRMLQEYIGYQSVSGHEKEAGLYLSELCGDLGFNVNILTPDDTAFNFTASLYPLDQGKPNIILLNHMDVVPVSDSSEWTYPPYSATVIYDTIWGRGCLDMKGIAVMQILSAARFIDLARQQDLPYNVTVLFTSGEELGGTNGAGLITGSYLSKLNHAVVLGEGGAGIRGAVSSHPEKLLFGISVAEKKSLWLKFELRSKAPAHGAIPSTKNATKSMLRVVIKMLNIKPDITLDQTTKNMFSTLGQLTGGARGFIISHFNWWVFSPFRRKMIENQPILLALTTNTIQLTKFYNPAGPPNQVPELAITYFDCRLLPGTSEEKFLKKLRNKINNRKVNIDILFNLEDAPATKPDIFYAAFKEVLEAQYPGAVVVPILFPASTDNSYFRGKNIPVFGILPFELDNQLIETIHGVDERIPVVLLNKGIETYSRFLEKALSQKPH